MGPITPAKKMANATGMVTSAASQVLPLTRVPIISARLPVTARPRCAVSLSRRVPPKLAKISVANPPNVANRVICTSPMTLKVSANRPGTTMVARTARIAAGTDQVTRQGESAASRGRHARDRRAVGTAAAGSGMGESLRKPRTDA